jgi:hypothetical protein
MLRPVDHAFVSLNATSEEAENGMPGLILSLRTPAIKFVQLRSNSRSNPTKFMTVAIEPKMAPQLFPNQHYTRSLNTTFPKTTTDYVSAQWVNPADIFSVLLLLGPGIVQQAVAQLAGHQVTPVALSFGWVAYSVNALQAVVGGG